MEISIVIPNLNSGKYLEECLNSIFTQSYKNFEVIIVDGYSTDTSQKTIEKFARRNNEKLLITYKRPEGQSDAINAGILLTTGDIVTYICADDVYEPKCLERVVKSFTGNLNTKWLYGKGKIINSEGKKVRSLITKAKELLQPRYSYSKLQCVDFIVQPTFFIRKEFYNQIGQFNTELKYSMEYDYYLRAGKVSNPIFINKYLANWRAHSQSLSEREHKAEARQALDIQRRYSKWYFRPIQYTIYILTILLYSIINKLR